MTHSLRNTSSIPSMAHAALKASVVALSLCLLGACGSASYVKRDARGGQLALHGSYGFAIGDARARAIDHCDGPYDYHDQDHILHYSCRSTAPLRLPTAPSPDPARDATARR